MIKTNELRIGNLVFLNDKQKVWEIMDGFDIDEMTENSTVDPIPISEEWFLNFGFNRITTNEYWFVIPLKDRSLNVSTVGSVEIKSWDMLCISIGCVCEYVHQLQNLYFALTGNELNIKP